MNDGDAAPGALALRISAFRVFVHDLAAARQFYAGALMLPLRSENVQQGWLVFDLGGPQLVVERIDPDAPEDEQVLAGRFTGLSLQVADIQAAHARLGAAGVYFSGAPERQAWGGWLATFEDPAGNSLQLVQHPP